MKIFLKIFFLNIVFLVHSSVYASRKPVPSLTRTEIFVNQYLLQQINPKACSNQESGLSHLTGHKVNESEKIPSNKIIHQDFLDLKIRTIHNETNLNLALYNNFLQNWLTVLIKPQSKCVVNRNFLEGKCNLRSCFYDQLGDHVQKDEKNIEINLGQRSKLGFLFVNVFQNDYSDARSSWVLNKCKQCNDFRLKNKSCPHCLNTHEKLKNKRNIAVDLKFGNKNGKASVAYQVDLNDNL